MKKMMRILSLVLIVCAMGTMLFGCSNSAKPFIRQWDCYKVSTGTSEIEFSKFAGIVDMKMTAEFTADGHYEIHYYVGGKEGDKYPQTGTYTMEGDVLVMDDGGRAEIVNSELILSYSSSEGVVKQYYR